MAVIFAQQMNFQEHLQFELIFVKVHFKVTPDLSKQIIHINNISDINIYFFCHK